VRILVYSIVYAPEPTSTGKYAGQMASWLASQGHHVDAIASHPHYPHWRVREDYARRGSFVEELDGVRVFRTPLYVPPAERAGAWNRIRYELSFGRNALRHWLGVIGRQRYDVVIAICPPLQNALYPWLYRAIRGVPWLFHVQDLQVDVALRLGMLARGPLARPLHFVENFLLRRCDRVSTISEAMRQRIIAKGVAPERAWLIPNWADLDTIHPMARETPFRAKCGAEDEHILLLYAGNIGRKQEFGPLLDAAQRLQDHREYRFAIVGEGAAKTSLQRDVERMGLDNVVLLGVQPAEGFAEVLGGADVHLILQRREASDLVMPSKLTNALASGRAILATADPGTTLHAEITRSAAGLAIPPDDAPALVGAIRKLGTDRALREEMGLAARRHAEKTLDKDNILRDFERKLLSLTSEESGAA
jgi:putative colanic acid biosynthesis glycosyltransferase WcaI